MASRRIPADVCMLRYPHDAPQVGVDGVNGKHQGEHAGLEVGLERTARLLRLAVEELVQRLASASLPVLGEDGWSQFRQPGGVVEHLTNDGPADVGAGRELALDDGDRAVGVNHDDVRTPDAHGQLADGNGTGADALDEARLVEENLLELRLVDVAVAARGSPFPSLLPDPDVDGGAR